MYYLVSNTDWVNTFTYLSSYTGMIWALVQIFLAALICATPVAWMMIETDYGWSCEPQPEEENSMASYEEADTVQDEDLYKEAQIRAWLYSQCSKDEEWLWDYLCPHGAEALEIRNTMMSLPQESWEDYINSLKVMYAA